jgi:hypothetical protein
MCIKCAPGMHQPKAGHLKCIDLYPLCAVGKYRLAPAARKKLLASGLLIEKAAHTCMVCPSGKFQPKPTNTTYCKQCAPGHFQNEYGQGSCTMCGVGREQPQFAQASCFKAIIPTSAPTPVVCKPGRYAHIIPANSSSTVAGVRHHAHHQRRLLRQSQRQTGASFRVRVKSMMTPTDDGPSPTGAYSPSPAICLPCAVGRYQALEGQSSCQQCGRGQYVYKQGGSSCVQCPQGMVSIATACVRLRGKGVKMVPHAQGQAGRGPMHEDAQLSTPGTSDDAAALMVGVSPVPLTHLLPGQKEGVPKPLLTSFGIEGPLEQRAAALALLHCPAGKFLTDVLLGRWYCNGCTPGQYQDRSLAQECKVCPSGKFASDMGGAQCTSCKEGEQQPARGLTECFACGKGQYQLEKAQASCVGCPKCPGGEFLRMCANATAGRCVACPKGKYRTSSPTPFAQRGAWYKPGECLTCYFCPMGQRRIGCGGVSGGTCHRAATSKPAASVSPVEGGACQCFYSTHLSVLVSCEVNPANGKLVVFKLSAHGSKVAIAAGTGTVRTKDTGTDHVCKVVAGQCMCCDCKGRLTAAPTPALPTPFPPVPTPEASEALRTTLAPTCVDASPKCVAAAARGWCDQDVALMHKKCCASCTVPKPNQYATASTSLAAVGKAAVGKAAVGKAHKVASGCIDMSSKCESAAAMGWCTRQKWYMMAKCRKSCAPECKSA